MSKISLKIKVNFIIVFSFIGILLAFPFQHTFIGGLLTAAFIAAVIGGLADSFAVSALFGQPLKVNWPSWMGTRIIARNRERLISELVDMVEQELLSTDIIKKQLKQYQAADVIVNYLQNNEGKQQIDSAIYSLLSDLIKVIDPQVLKLAISRFAEQGASSFPAAKLLREVLKWSMEHRYDEPLIAVISEQLRMLVVTERCRNLLIQFIEKALQAYEQDKKGRQFVNGIAGLNAEELSTKLQQIAIQFLEQVNDQEHPFRKKLTAWVQTFIEQLEADEMLQQRINGLVSSAVKYITRNWISEQKVVHILESLMEQLDERQQPSKLQNWLEHQLDQAIAALIHDKNRLQQLNQYIQNAMIAFVEHNHRYIGEMVRRKLETYSEQELIALVDEKAGKDLQYIRINGIVVGSFIGVVLFLIHRVIGGLFG